MKPKFLRFPGIYTWIRLLIQSKSITLFDLINVTLFSLGGCFVEGDYLRNAFRWKETIGPWEKRPGHFNGVWGHWTDDGFGYLEFLQVYTCLFFTHTHTHI